MHARTIYARTYIIIVIVVVIGGGSDPWPSTVMITHTHTHTHQFGCTVSPLRGRSANSREVSVPFSHCRGVLGWREGARRALAGACVTAREDGGALRRHREGRRRRAEAVKVRGRLAAPANKREARGTSGGNQIEGSV